MAMCRWAWLVSHLLRGVGFALGVGSALAAAAHGVPMQVGADSTLPIDRVAAIASPTPSATCLRLPCPFGRVPYCPGCPAGCGTECVTPTPAPPICAGDCNGDGRVTIDELVQSVDIAQAVGGEIDECAALDMNRDGDVSIDEIVAAVQAALVGCPAGRDVWEPIGPRSVAVRAIAVDPTDSRIIHAAAGDAVYTTSDEGRTWRSTSLFSTLRAIVIDPHEPSVYVAAIDGMIAKSTDRGATWQAVGAIPRAGLHALTIDGRTDALYAVSYDTVFRSVDGALTWSRVEGQCGDGRCGGAIEIPSLSLASPAKLYLGLYRDGVIVVDLDLDTNLEPVRAARVSSTTGYCAILSGGAGDLICALAAAPSRSEIAYAHENYGATCKTVDGGRTWTDIAPIGCPPPDVDPECAQRPYDDVGCTELIVDANNPDVVYAANNPLLATTDGGTSFHRVGSGLPAQLAVHTVVVDPVQSTTLYIGTDDGIYRLRAGR